MPREHWSKAIPESGSPAVLKEMQRIQEEANREADRRKAAQKQGSVPETQPGGKRN